MNFLFKWVIQAIAISVGSYLVPGVTVDNFVTALIVAAVLALLNILVKPLLLILTLPITILTLGLFTFIIDVVIFLLAAALIPGFAIAGFLPAVLFALVLAVLNALINRL